MLFVLACAAYLYFNPKGKFGFCTENLVIYNRMPIPYFDLLVNSKGEKFPLENLNKPLAFEDVYKKITKLHGELKEAESKNREFVLIVGTGFGEKPIFSLQNKTNIINSLRWLPILEMPSRRAVKEYNSLAGKGKYVAILLKIKDQ